MVADLLIKVFPIKVKATHKWKNCVSCIQQASTFTNLVKQWCTQHLQLIPGLTAHLRKASKHVVGNAHDVVQVVKRLSESLSICS